MKDLKNLSVKMSQIPNYVFLPTSTPCFYNKNTDVFTEPSGLIHISVSMAYFFLGHCSSSANKATEMSASFFLLNGDLNRLVRGASGASISSRSMKLSSSSMEVRNARIFEGVL